MPEANTGTSGKIDENTLLRLAPSAIKNKTPLLFLERAVAMCPDSEPLKEQYRTFLEKSRLCFDLTRRISKTLNQIKPHYVIFKTFKPFPFATVDIDILFFNRRDLIRTSQALQNQGFKLAGYGPFSITLYSPEHDMNLDLQLEVSVSRLIYIDKSVLQRHVTKIDVGGCQVSVLDPPAELVMIIAHSFYKEQMLTLAEYYTIAIQTSRMTKDQRRTFVDLAAKLNITTCLTLVFNLINALTVMAFNEKLPSLVDTAQLIQTSEIEEKAMQIGIKRFVKGAELPYKYHPIPIALAFAVKSARDTLMRSSLSQQMFEMVTNTSNFVEDIWLHIKRDAY